MIINTNASSNITNNWNEQIILCSKPSLFSIFFLTHPLKHGLQLPLLHLLGDVGQSLWVCREFPNLHVLQGTARQTRCYWLKGHHILSWHVATLNRTRVRKGWRAQQIQSSCHLCRLTILEPSWFLARERSWLRDHSTLDPRFWRASLRLALGRLLSCLGVSEVTCGPRSSRAWALLGPDNMLLIMSFFSFSQSEGKKEIQICLLRQGTYSKCGKDEIPFRLWSLRRNRAERGASCWGQESNLKHCKNKPAGRAWGGSTVTSKPFVLLLTQFNFSSQHIHGPSISSKSTNTTSLNESLTCTFS